MKKDFKSMKLKDQERLRNIISQKLSNAMKDIQEATGYYPDLHWSILSDTIAKSVEIDLKISLLGRPHNIDMNKVKHYLKVNPHNVLDEPILAFKWNHWYEIYNGVHRVECTRQLGKKTIKATIIEPDKDSLEGRELI